MATNKAFKRIPNIKFIKPLLAIARCMALSPYNFDLNASRKRGKIVHARNFYALLLISIILLLSVGQLYRKSTTVYAYMEKSVTIVDATSTVCLLLVNITSILSLNFLNKEEYNLFMTTFIRVDLVLSKFDVVAKNKSNRFYIQLGVLLSLFGIYLIYDGYFWIATGEATYFLFRVIETFQKCHLYVFFILIYNFITAIQQRFRCINVLIERVIRNYVNVKTTESRVVKVDDASTVHHMKKLSKLFINTSDNVELFNVIYGCSILISLAYIMSSILLWINYLISYGFVSEEGQEFINWFQINLITTKVIWTGFVFTMNVVLAKSADSVVKEVRRTNLMCYKLAQAVEDVDSQEETLRQDLISLAQQSSSRCPRFTAAGFFGIDYSMLFTLLNMFTSYLIVLIQFHK